MLFIQNLFTRPDYFICWIVIVSFSICVHEFCHAYAAVSQGDDTPARGGYLSLDPRRLMGAYSLVMLLFIGFAWGAVPVNPGRMRHRWSPALVAVSGPAANLFLAFCFALLLALSWRLDGDSTARALQLLFRCGLQANCLLALFNMLPLPMLDGWSVYALAIPQLGRIDPHRAQSISWIVILLLWLTPLGGFFWRLVGTTAERMAGVAEWLIP